LLAEVDEYWTEKVAELEKRYPYFVKCPLDNAYGIALYSRLELRNAELKFLIEDDIPFDSRASRFTVWQNRQFILSASAPAGSDRKFPLARTRRRAFAGRANDRQKRRADDCRR
jgi:endonuclease/exonuclease/phosphatase (EEP) superfamily protein YafD